MRQLGWRTLCLLAGLGACASPSGNRIGRAFDAGPEDAGYADGSREPQPDAERPETPDAAAPADASTEPKDAASPEPKDAASPEPPAVVKADTYAITSKQRLVRLQRANGAIQRALAVGGLPAGEALIGADVRPADGKLYALGASGKLYRVDTDSGAAELVATLRADPKDQSSPFAALSGKRFEVDWNPAADRLRVVSDAGENLRIDAASGNTTTDGELRVRSVVAAAYTQSFATACRTRLLTIDANSRSLLLQDPPNLGQSSPIGSLGAEAFEDVTAFEIQTAPDGSDRGLLAATRGDSMLLLDVDLARGTAERPRKLALEPGERVIGLGIAPPDGDIPQQPGEFTGLTERDRLITFNRGAPGKLCSAASLTGLPDGERLLGIDVRPADGELYGLGKSGALYRLSIADARATRGSSLLADAADTSDRYSALPGAQLGLSWNPVVDRLRVLGPSGQNLRVDPASGATTTDAALSGESELGTLEAAYTNSFAGARTTTLYALSAARGLVRIGGDPASSGACAEPADVGNPNCGVARLIGALGIADLRVQGFDIDGKTGAAWAVLGSATESALYSVDLTTGQASAPLGTIGGGEALRAFALTRDPKARAIALTSAGRLLTFDLQNPSAPVSNIALQPAQTLLDFDVRPADGKLYGLGDDGKLYTVDASAGSLAAVSGKALALGDASYGIDWNPFADALRVVGSDGSNLRVAFDARDMPVMDSSLNPGAPSIVAAAYSRSYAGTTGTTLYVIDSERDFLFVQGGIWEAPSPNGGTLTAIGALGVDALGKIGFDIAGGHDGLAVAAIRTHGERSELYSVNLARGWATPFNTGDNAIGGSDGAAVVGLAIDLR